MRVSHETIYRSPNSSAWRIAEIPADGSSAIRSARKQPLATRNQQWTVTRSDCRPPSRSAKDLRKTKTERFLVIGKADVLSGAKNSYIATLVERHSRIAMLIKVRSKET